MAKATPFRREITLFRRPRSSGSSQASKPPLGSIPEHGQQLVTLEDLANMTAQMQESPVSRNPATPSEHPEEAQKCPHAMTVTTTKRMQKEEALLPLIYS